MASIIDWPAALRPASVDWGLIVPQEVARSTFDGSMQAATLGPPRWAFTLTTGPIKLADVPLWEALVDQLFGGVNRLRVWDFRREAPLGVATGTPTVRVSATGSTLATQGWTASTAGILLAGSYFGVNGELKRLTVDAASDGSGRATLSFVPPLRAAPAVSAALTLTKPKALFVLTSERPSFAQQGSRVPSVTLAFEEAFA